jgi:hypothetical protein
MQALEGGRSRFALAQEESRKALGNFATGAKVDVFITVPKLERVGDQGMDIGAARAAIGTLRPYDLDEATSNPGEVLSGFVKGKGYDRVYLFTDHPTDRQGEVVKVVTVGAPKNNLAIAGFHVSPVSLIGERHRASAEVRSFSAGEEKVRITVSSSGKTLATRELAVAAAATVEVSFDNLPARPYYEATLNPNDGFALDNRRFAVLPSREGWEILGVSPQAAALESLRSIAGLSVKVVSPQDYAKQREGRHRLEIFHYSMPGALPDRNALFILPPTTNILARLGPPLQRPVISGWRAPHPLTDYVNFALLRPSYGRALIPTVVAKTVLEGPGGALAFTFEERGFRYAVLGFDPLPYLGRDNLPMSIFTLNLFKWFASALGAGEKRTGESIGFAPVTAAGFVVTPKGERIALRPGISEFAATFSQGIYQVHRGAELETIAVNFFSPLESDLLHPVPLALPEEARPEGDKPGFMPLWALLLLGAVALLLVERFLNPPALHQRLAGAR